MKNPFVLASLILAAGYPLAIAAQFVGVLSFTVLSLPVFIGCFTSAGVLAIVVRDYAPKSVPGARRIRQPAPQPKTAVRPTPAPASATWAYQTLSA